MKSYGGTEGLTEQRNSRRLGRRLEKRRSLMQNRRLVVDIVCGLALTGIALMMIETELYILGYVDKSDALSFVFKICISASTVLLLIGICVNYYINIKIKALDAGVKDWHSVITDTTLMCLIAELTVCAIHPFPGDITIKVTSPDGMSRKVSIDAVLSILMMARLYLIAKFAVVHSHLLTDSSTTSIGALSKIKINTLFVFKAAMTNSPSRLILAVMVTTFLVNSWAMRTCEIYYQNDKGGNSYMEVMWLIATTFLTVGYGDKIPQSYCGRYISICTGVMGVGTTALLVAVLARKLEQSRSERYVFNMVSRIQIEKRRKTAASNVIKAVIQLWMIKKYSIQDKNLRRKYEDNLKTSIRQLRLAKADRAHIDDFNVGVIEVSETVNRIGNTIERMESAHSLSTNRERLIENRLEKIEDKLEEIRSLLPVTR